MSLTCNALRRIALRRFPSVANTSLLSPTAQHQHEQLFVANGPLQQQQQQQQRRTMVLITKSSAADPKPEVSVNVTTPAAIPSDITVDNPEELSVEITPSCVKQVRNLLNKKEKSPQEMFLRVYVDPGGCSGFQYRFELDDDLVEDEDFVFEPPGSDGVRVVVDEASLKLIHGSKIDYVQEMIKSAFVVAENPQSESACGCGSSFAIKNFSANPALD